MIRVKILFINFLLFLSSRAKPFKALSTDSENTHHAIKVTPGPENDKESLTIYIKNDNVLSISEFTKLYNPEEQHFNNFRLIRENDSDYVKKVRSINNKTTLDIPNLDEYNEENKTERNIDATTIDSKVESRSDELSTETNEIDSTTISIEDQVRSGGFIEGYEDELEVPEYGESTERYFKTVAFNDKTNSDRLDDIVLPIPLRRSLFENDLDYEGRTGNKPVEIIEVDQDTVPKSEIISVKTLDKENEIKSNAGTPFVAPQIKHPLVISNEQFHNSDPNRSAVPTDLPEMSNQETSNIALTKMAPEENEESNNFDTSGEIGTNEKTIDDFNSNNYRNAYPYTPSNDNSISQQPITKEAYLNSLYLKLNQASELPLRNRLPNGNSFPHYGAILPNFNLRNRFLQNFGAYNVRPISRQLLSCNNCGHNGHRMYIN